MGEHRLRVQEGEIARLIHQSGVDSRSVHAVLGQPIVIVSDLERDRWVIRALRKMRGYDYPMHQRLKKIAHLSEAQGEFVEWAQQHGYLDPIVGSTLEDLLAEFWGIDRNILEHEKRAMLAEIREQQT